jgi:uncharacterized protein YaeQ
MAPKGTIYNFEIDLADNDRSIYEKLKFTVSMHPSENLEYMITRVLAYCLEYTEGLTFTKGLDEPDQPALWAYSLDGRLTHWIEVGHPSFDKLHRANKTGARVAVYCHKNPAAFLEQVTGKDIYKSNQIEIYSLESRFIKELLRLTDKRLTMSLSVSEKQLYLDVTSENLNSEIIKHLL